VYEEGGGDIGEGDVGGRSARVVVRRRSMFVYG
jgi:hypothetical protein